MFHCDLLSKASNYTPLRHQPAEIESDHNEYAIDYISDVKIGNWFSRRGSYLQLLTDSVGYNVPEWILLEQVDDCEQLSVFLSSDVWYHFSQAHPYVQFQTKHPDRDVDLQK